MGVCVTTETRHLDRLGQLGEFEQDSNTDSEQESNTGWESVWYHLQAPSWPSRSRGLVSVVTHAGRDGGTKHACDGNALTCVRCRGLTDEAFSDYRWNQRSMDNV